MSFPRLAFKSCWKRYRYNPLMVENISGLLWESWSTVTGQKGNNFQGIGELRSVGWFTEWVRVQGLECATSSQRGKCQGGHQAWEGLWGFWGTVYSGHVVGTGYLPSYVFTYVPLTNHATGAANKWSKI